ncbi:hypothetical protein EV122DRAFT_172433, partial [Schizophyllum commune]
AEVSQAIAESRILPCATVDVTPDRRFSSAVSLEEIAAAKVHAHERNPNSAVGFDRQSYAVFVAIPNEALQDLISACLRDRDAPHALAPSSYRLIGLESCLLKMVTFIIERRMVTWMEDMQLLPDTQNGFRHGRHGLTNPFILRCAIDRSLAERRPLFAVFPELTNAFPSTVHEILWLALYDAGMRGPMFD